MLIKWLRRLKQNKYRQVVETKFIHGKGFCESPMYADKTTHLYNNLKVVNKQSKEQVVFGDHNNVAVSIYLQNNGNVRTGDYVYMNSNCRFYISNELRIGSYCLFGPNVTIWDSDNHPIDPILRKQDAMAIPNGALNAFSVGGGDVTIGENVWIGMDVLILGGVTIGDNSVIAARSVVTKDVPESCVVAGVPAKFVKSVSDE